MTPNAEGFLFHLNSLLTQPTFHLAHQLSPPPHPLYLAAPNIETLHTTTLSTISTFKMPVRRHDAKPPLQDPNTPPPPYKKVNTQPPSYDAACRGDLPLPAKIPADVLPRKDQKYYLMAEADTVNSERRSPQRKAPTYIGIQYCVRGFDIFLKLKYVGETNPNSSGKACEGEYVLKGWFHLYNVAEIYEEGDERKGVMEQGVMPDEEVVWARKRAKGVLGYDGGIDGSMFEVGKG